MRNWLLLGLLAGLGLTAGCQTVTQTGKENRLAQRQIMQLEFREIADDCNMVMMTDRQNRLTKWQTR
jgi:hypothetical protein